MGVRHAVTPRKSNCCIWALSDGIKKTVPMIQNPYQAIDFPWRSDEQDQRHTHDDHARRILGASALSLGRLGQSTYTIHLPKIRISR